MGPLIYLPDKKVAQEADLEAIGLASLLDPLVTMMTTEILGNGPDGRSGVLVHWDSAQHPELRTPRSIDKTTQEWLPAVPHGQLLAGRYWLGLPLGGLSPHSLRRRVEMPGHAVRLRDGHEWTVPAAYWEGNISLPCQQKLDPMTGNECRSVLSEHTEFYEAAQRYFQLFLDEGTPEQLVVEQALTVTGGFDYAVMALQKNYRVCRDMVNRLELMGDIELMQVICATLGYQQIVEIEDQKKTAELATIPAT